MARHRRSENGHVADERDDAPRPAPGKRARTDGLVQRASARAPASSPRSAPGLASTIDPFDWAALSAPDIQLVGPGGDPKVVHDAAAAGVATPAQSLPYLDTLTAAFGEGHELGSVRAHVGGEAEASAHAMGAQAYATGRDVVLPAQPSLHLVAHETTHVVQQRAGVHLAGGVGAAGDAYEREADSIADAVVRGERVGDRLPGGSRSSDDIQRRQGDANAAGGDTSGSSGMWQHVIGERSTTVDKLARVRAPRGVRLRNRPAAGADDAGIAPFDELLQVERRTEHGWCWVVAMGAMGGTTGFCEEQFLSLDPPEPTAHLHRVEPGERLADIAVRHYGADLRSSNQVRLYVQALYLANKDHAGVYLDEVKLELRDMVGRDRDEIETVEIYKSAKVRAGHAIWVPSDAFIAQLQVAGLVSDGATAFSKARRAMTGVVEHAVDAAVYGAGLVVGLMHGAWNAIADLFAGAADMVEAVAKVAYHVVTGNPGAVKDMLMGWVDKLAIAWAHRDKLADEFMRKWEADDGWDRGNFQGEVLGWVMMTALIAILTAGEGAAVMMTGRWASVLRALQTLDALGDVSVYARKIGKLPARAVELVKAKAGKAGPKAERSLDEAADGGQDLARAATGPRDGEAPRRTAGALRVSLEEPIELGGDLHHLRLWEKADGGFVLTLCSDCSGVREAIADVLASAPANGPGKSLRRRLAKLAARVEELEDGLASGKVKHTAAVTELNQIAAHLREAYRKFPAADALCVFCSFKARLDYDSLARSLGFERTGALSHGQPVYRHGNVFISKDVDGHNGGVWKKATGSADNLRNRSTRDGTFNEDLTEQVGS